MKTTETEHVDAGRFAWFAARDAKMRSAINASRFTDKQKLRGEQIKLALSLLYSYKELTLDYTKRHIRVKVSNANIKDRKTLRERENEWAIEGIEKVLTNQGIIYRVK
jgi:hypothetical protein